MKKILIAIITLIALASLASINVKAETLPANRTELITELGSKAILLGSDRYMFWSHEEHVLTTKLSDDTTETFSPSTRKWVGLPYVAITDGGRMFAAYMTGGFLEPDNNNYGVIYYSDDMGATWSEDFLIFTCKSQTGKNYTPVVFSFNGQLLIYLAGFEITLTNPDAQDLSHNAVFNKPYTTGFGLGHKPVVLSNGVIVVDSTSTSENGATKIYGSRNGLKWEKISEYYPVSGANKKFGEGAFTVYGEDIIFSADRLDSAPGLEVAYSEDGGYTWSTTELGSGLPLATSYTKPCAATLSNDVIVFANNNTTKDRSSMTLWLSYDGGKTWPYQLEIDGRCGYELGYWGVSYPDIVIDKDDNIYVLWDQRTPLIEINMCKVTEADIKAGHIVTEGSYTNRHIFANGTYKETVSTQQTFTHYYEVEVGGSVNNIISSLPTTIAYTDSKGGQGSLTGSWVCEEFDSSKAGYYTYKFNYSSAPDGLVLTDDIFKVYVKVCEKSSKGCSMSLTATSIVASAALLGAVILKKKKEEN